MRGHLRNNRNIYVQRQYVRESSFRTDPAGYGMKWFNTITRRVYGVRGPNSLGRIDGLHCAMHEGFDNVLDFYVVQQTVLHLHLSYQRF